MTTTNRNEQRPPFQKRPGEVCGLWYKESQDGRRYFSGRTERGNRVIIYLEDNKKSERAPDARLYIYQDSQPQQATQGNGRQQPPAPYYMPRSSYTPRGPALDETEPEPGFVQDPEEPEDY